VNSTTLLLISLILMLLAYPLASFGTEGGAAWLSWTALALLAVGGLIPAVLRFTRKEE
jgi:hypothetical protein